MTARLARTPSFHLLPDLFRSEICVQNTWAALDLSLFTLPERRSFRSLADGRRNAPQGLPAGPRGVRGACRLDDGASSQGGRRAVHGVSVDAISDGRLIREAEVSVTAGFI